jgi:hypothetical protein
MAVYRFTPACRQAGVAPKAQLLPRNKLLIKNNSFPKQIIGFISLLIMVPMRPIVVPVSHQSLDLKT